MSPCVAYTISTHILHHAWENRIDVLITRYYNKSAIQCENVNRGHARFVNRANVQNGMTQAARRRLHSSVACVVVDNCLSAVRHTRLHSDTVQVVLLKSFKVISFYSFVANSFTKLLAPKYLKLIHIFTSKIWFSLHRRISFISIICAVGGCPGSRVSWYPVLYKLISYLREDLRLIVDSLYQKFLLVTNIFN